MKRFASMTLIVVLSLVLLAGCGGGGTNGDNASTNGSGGNSSGTTFNTAEWLSDPANAARFEKLTFMMYPEVWDRGRQPIANVTTVDADKEALVDLLKDVTFETLNGSNYGTDDFAFAAAKQSVIFSFTEDTLIVRVAKLEDAMSFVYYSATWQDNEALTKVHDYIGNMRNQYFEGTYGN